MRLVTIPSPVEREARKLPANAFPAGILRADFEDNPEDSSDETWSSTLGVRRADFRLDFVFGGENSMDVVYTFEVAKSRVIDGEEGLPVRALLFDDFVTPRWDPEAS